MMLFLAKMFVSLVAAAICLLPAWIFMGLAYFLHPNTFWEKLVLVVTAGSVLGTIQFFALGFLLLLGQKIWSMTKI